MSISYRLITNTTQTLLSVPPLSVLPSLGSSHRSAAAAGAEHPGSQLAI